MVLFQFCRPKDKIQEVKINFPCKEISLNQKKETILNTIKKEVELTIDLDAKSLEEMRYTDTCEIYNTKVIIDIFIEFKNNKAVVFSAGFTPIKNNYTELKEALITFYKNEIINTDSLLHSQDYDFYYYENNVYIYKLFILDTVHYDQSSFYEIYLKGN